MFTVGLLVLVMSTFARYCFPLNVTMSPCPYDSLASQSPRSVVVAEEPRAAFVVLTGPPELAEAVEAIRQIVRYKLADRTVESNAVKVSVPATAEASK